MKPQRIVILGGTGFVGSHIVPRLHADGHTIVILSRNREQHRDLSVLPRASVVTADVHDGEVLRRQLAGADVAINLVGILNERGSDGSGFRKAHVELTETLIAACRAAGVARLLQMSALRAGEGESFYLITRGEAEAKVKSSPLAWTIFRPSVIFGRGDGLFYRFANLLRMTPVLPLARANAKFTPVYIGDVAEAFASDGVLDGELLVRGVAQGGEAGSFNALQQRLNRRTVSARMLADFPAFVRLYDILFDGAEDLRALPWTERRARLEALVPTLDPVRFDLSALIEAPDFAALADIRAGARDAAIEGVMLKRRDSPYVAGRRTGLWYKWKRDPLLVDCVLMYAQRGSGKRSSFYSDYTFGCWDGDPDQGAELLPVGKAYFGFTDEELKQLDRYVRNHTVNKFGPVRETDRSLVFEVAFDSVHASKRHKSGLAMRFPRISRIRWDKPAEEADRIGALEALIRD